MIILAIETSTPAGSVALFEAPPAGDGFWDRGRILGETALTSPETHSARLMPAVDRLLRDACHTIRQVQGIALGLGPGSFTGLRIAVSTVKGLAYSLGVPVVGVPTLDALAHNVPFASTQICAVLDARKKEVYGALFRGNGEGQLAKGSEDWVLSPEDLCLRVVEKTLFLGNALETYGEVFREKLGSRALFAPPELCAPRAAVVARLALPDFKAGRTLDVFSFTPLYVRRSEAEVHYHAKEPG